MNKLICKKNEQDPSNPYNRFTNLNATSKTSQLNYEANYVTSPSRIHEIHLQVLRAVESCPGLTQRGLANELGVSLGKAHYCMKALIDKGLVKMGNFSHNQKKMDYAYLSTPSGIKSKASLTLHFLERKAAECAKLKSELEEYEKDKKNLEQDNLIKKITEGAAQ
jgi:EPS-associated MarR family transcriptional regulator